MTSRPRIGITLGDPAGIGPEIIAKALANQQLHQHAELRPIGAPDILKHWGLDARAIAAGELRASDVQPGQVSGACGTAALDAIREGVRRCQAGELDALVTGPINKRAAQMAGMRVPGHTELIAELCGNPEVRMLLAGNRLRTIHVSTHISLHEACHTVTMRHVFRTIQIGHDVAQLLGFAKPRIAIAGLNPHAGEHGLFGDEDERQIVPAVDQAAKHGIDARGPLPPDTVFLRAFNGEFDLVVAMYHDQGHIPMKLVEFDQTVNITAGLPILRVSVDHGTAFDIAGKNIARPDNMIRAIDVATRLAAGKSGN